MIAAGERTGIAAARTGAGSRRRFVSRVRRGVGKRFQRAAIATVPVAARIRDRLRIRVLQPLLELALTRHWGTRSAERAVRHIAFDSVTEPAMRAAERRAVTIPASFAAELTRRSAVAARCTQTLPDWWVNDKVRARSVAERAGFPLPALYGENIPFSQIDFSRPCVIKPPSAAGSNGVFIVRDSESIIDVKRRCRYDSLDELRAAVDALRSRDIRRDGGWIVEEYIGSGEGIVPIDLKFYTFYGMVGLVLALDRNAKVTRFCFRGRDGVLCHTGKYEGRAGYRPFGGCEIDEETFEAVEALSAMVPAPFVRIDLLKGAERLYFGEFTPRPGGYHLFNKRTDRLLGDLFLDAEARLNADWIASRWN